MNRDFKGIWIPKEIWLHPKLSVQAKVLWAEINSLHDEERGGCYASDEYLIKFLGVKISRLHEVMKELRDLGLIEKVSFNGRSRVIRSLCPNQDCGRQPSGKPEPCIPENRKSGMHYTGTLPYNRDIRRDISLDSTSLKVSSNQDKSAKAEEAKASQVGDSHSQHKKIKQADDYSPDVIEVSNKIFEIAKDSTPEFRPPKNINPFLAQVDFMLRIDGRKPESIYAVLKFALNDYFYGPGLLTGNLAQKLRDKFATLHKKMTSKFPEPKKERKFGEFTPDFREEYRKEISKDAL